MGASKRNFAQFFTKISSKNRGLEESEIQEKNLGNWFLLEGFLFGYQREYLEARIFRFGPLEGEIYFSMPWPNFVPKFHVNLCLYVLGRG